MVDPYDSNQKYISLGRFVINFGGKSRWSNVSEPKLVEVHVVIDCIIDEENDYHHASVLAFFEADQWVVEGNGHIYTDKTFKEELRDILVAHGYSDDLGYSESGMQCETYVHFDFAINDKLEAEEGNYIVDWEDLNEKQELADLRRDIKILVREVKEKIAQRKELEKKLDN